MRCVAALFLSVVLLVCFTSPPRPDYIGLLDSGTGRMHELIPRRKAATIQPLG